MNFTPLLSHLTSSIGTLPTVNSGSISFSNVAKHAPNSSTGTTFTGGQVVAVLNSNDSGVTYLHPVDINNYSVNVGNSLPVNQHQNQVISLPVTISGTKSSDHQPHAFQIQVVNPNSVRNHSEKLIPVPLQHFGQVLQVAYNHQSSVNKSSANVKMQSNTLLNCQNNHASNDIVSVQKTVQYLGGGKAEMYSDVKPSSFNDLHNPVGTDKHNKNSNTCPLTVIAPPEVILGTSLSDHEVSNDNNVKDEGNDSKGISSNKNGWQAIPINNSFAEYFSNLSSETIPISLHHFLKLSSDTIKQVSSDSSPTNENVNLNDVIFEDQKTDEFDQAKAKKRKRSKKKPPKPKRPRPGQVHIATSVDGTSLFCCPECDLAYPEINMLEQHLIAHKIERRFICDICGAGLKRKEHLERHRLGHSPERPYVCTICSKGFKRKEHLNLHVIIHSGEKTEICTECGKGFYRKDHLRKHVKSHLTKRIREDLQQQQLQKQQQQLERQQFQLQRNHQHHQLIEPYPEALIIAPSQMRQYNNREMFIQTAHTSDEMLIACYDNDMHDPLEPATIITPINGNVENILVEPDCHVEHQQITQFKEEKT